MTRNEAVCARVLDQAIAWQLRLGEEDGERQPAELERWLAADPEHARAWTQLARIDQQLGAAIAPPARRALQKAAGSTRRRRSAQSALFGLALLGALCLGLLQQRPLQDWLADELTVSGQQRRLLLPDHSRIQLNSRSALDVRFDARQRRLVLHSGEVLVETAHGDPRPFIVATAEGDMRALGTRFLVRREGDSTRLIVLQSAVAARPRAAVEERIVREGEQVLLHNGQLGPSQAAPIAADAWSFGMLVADNMPLGQLLAQLGEYRSGYLGLDPSLSELRISGSFPLHDTERALAALPPSLPVRIERFGDWWVRVVPQAPSPQ